MLRQCFGSGTAADGHTPYKARPSRNWPKITTYDHVHQIFITSCAWFRRGGLCDRGLTKEIFDLFMRVYACLCNIHMLFNLHQSHNKRNSATKSRRKSLKYATMYQTICENNNAMINSKHRSRHHICLSPPPCGTDFTVDIWSFTYHIMIIAITIK